MKKRFLCIILLALICFAGCAQQGSPAPTDTQTQTDAPATQTQTQTQTQAEPTTIALPQDLPAVDYDLSAMSGTMMYAQAYDMIYNTEAYLGKTVRILGPVDRYTDEQSGQEHCVCLIRDATACCTQGIEFERTDPDASLPPDGETVLVSGTFDTYMNGPFLYCVLRDAVLEYPGES